MYSAFQMFLKIVFKQCRPWVLSILTRNQQHSSEWLQVCGSPPPADFYPRISLPRPPRINGLAPQLHLQGCRRTPCIWFPRCNSRYPLERRRVELATLTWARPRCSRPIDPVQRLHGAAWNLSECTAPDSSHSFIYLLFRLFVPVPPLLQDTHLHTRTAALL